MDFKIIKKDLRKPILWYGAMIFSSIVIFTIILTSLSIDIKEKLIIVLQVNLNFLLVYLVTIIINLSKTSISLFFNMEVLTDLDSNEKTLKIIKSKYFYIFITIFVIASFFIELSSGSIITKESWIINAKKTWWIFFILLIINTVYIYLFFETTRYLLSQNDQFKKAYINFINNPPKKLTKNEDDKSEIIKKEVNN